MIDGLVSIIIPLYNAQNYIRESITSAIGQTWPNKEIIIVDDGSTDNSLQIARSFQGNNIHVLTQPNKSASAARNLGLKHAKGQYVQFLDADDLLSPDKIERQVLALHGKNQCLSVCSTIHFHDGEDYAIFSPSGYEERFLKDIPSPVEFLIRIWGGQDGCGTMIQSNAWLTPMEVIKKAGEWDEQLSLDDDGEFFCRVILNSGGIIKAEGVFNYYRKHLKNSSLSGGRDIRSLTSQLNSALSKKKELLSRCNSKEARQAINRQLYDVFIFSYPAWPEIYKIAERELVGNTKDDRPSLGGKEINMIAGIFGIKMALRVRHLIRPNRL